ncbi:MAG: carbamoyl-phosphate synthase (glutamine-hydrolyzing) small subunit [Marinilabiliales bacterium]|nr:MAG: carbamoyl-phosphate synthase (glutamine-hydrolyzing) small subunit [Marinilabiliales bacterium]
MTGKHNYQGLAADLHKPVQLILQDGTVFSGQSFGYRQSLSGEVVFNTAMSGYPESLTDPSYEGQILVLTYPLIGNYGVPPMHKEGGLLRHFESEKIHITALVISEYSFESSHWNSWKTLSRWLIENKIPAISGIDTRALTTHLREHGVMPGKLIFDNVDTAFVETDKMNMVEKVSTKKVITYGKGSYKVVLVDCGVKSNIIRRLMHRDITVIRVPWDYDYHGMDYDGLFISNGPGDPRILTPAIKHLSKALEGDKPVFGICLGNQLLALAAGGNTYKLPYGHRSHNQPVLMKNTNRCFITSQNHGYASDMGSLGKEWEEFFVNLNDNTNEGIKHKKKPFFSTQFHPEAASGPTDTDFLFDEFAGMLKKSKK